MGFETGKERLNKRRKYIKDFVQKRHKQGVKISGAIYELSDKLFLSTRQIEMDLYYKGQTQKKTSKHKY